MKTFKPTNEMQSTSFTTTVRASYKQLEKIFGFPNSYGDDFKVSTEWILKSSDGKIVSLYDYKETNLYDRNYPTVEEFREKPYYDWHIGSKGIIEAEELKAFIIHELTVTE